MSPSVSRLLLIVALGLTLMVPSTALAAPGRVLPDARESLSSADVLAQVWTLVSKLWEKAGCKIDPDGQKAGCRIDPNGSPDDVLTSHPLEGEAGCVIDPNGYCVK